MMGNDANESYNRNSNVNRVCFKVLDGSIKTDALREMFSNLVKVDEDTYECDYDSALGGMDAVGTIKITSWDAPSLSGGDEPILTDDGDIMIARVDGGQVKLLEPGLVECLRCGCVQKINGSVNHHVCVQESCSRKGPFRRVTPPIFKVPWKLPGVPSPSDPATLFQEIVEFIKEHVVLPDGRLYPILGYWIMGTWVADSFPSLPYIFCLGPRESGKTRVLEVLEELSYRAVRSSTITPAALYRIIEEFGTTVLIDEAETQLDMRFEGGRTLYGILNAGYKKGDSAIRCGGADKDKIEIYRPFGFKALSSTRSFLPTLESRCIIINMEQNKPTRHIIDGAWSKDLRSQLLWFRCNCSSKIDIVNETLPTGRLTEMFIPLFSIQKLVDEGEKKTKMLIEYGKEIYEQRKEEERAGLEAAVVEIILNIAEHMPSQTAFDDGHTTRKITLKEIVDSFNSTYGDEFVTGSVTGLTCQRLGYILKELGIRPLKANDGRYIDFDDYKERFERLKLRYGLDGVK